jgi:tetratricopeptide (TPR) repeat protein
LIKGIIDIRIKRVVSFPHLFFVLYFIPSLLLFNFPAYSKFSFSPKIEESYSNFLKLKISRGQKLIQEAIEENPDNGIAIYMANYGDIIQLLISEDPMLYEKLQGNEDARMDKIKTLETSSPYYLFAQAEIKLQWAFVKLKFGDEGSAALNIKQAYQLLERNKKKFPDFIPNKKSSGLLNILIGSVPDKYIWIVNLIGMNGTIPNGMAMLNQVINSNSIYSLEASIYKVLVENYILIKDTKDRSSITKLSGSNQDNLLINFLEASILLKHGHDNEGLKAILSKPVSEQYIYIPFTEVMLGDIFIHKGDYEKARSYYLLFLKNYKGENFIKDSYYKIFLTHYLAGEDDKAETYIQKILENGQELTDADKYAQKFARKKELPDKILMKARLLSDGGHYQQALEILKEFKITGSTQIKNAIEYEYRQGRIYHNMEDYQKAIHFYVSTISLSEEARKKSNELVYYYAPNSALQLGYIYRKFRNKEVAKQYFNMALSYKDYEYKNSIDNKAKGALEELNKLNNAD